MTEDLADVVTVTIDAGKTVVEYIPEFCEMTLIQRRDFVQLAVHLDARDMKELKKWLNTLDI